MPMPPLPRVLCRGWLSSTGVRFHCAQPVMQPGEPGGKVIDGAQCALCGALNARATEVCQVRTARRTARRAAKGYGPAPEGVDVFKGFRQEG